MKRKREGFDDSWFQISLKSVSFLYLPCLLFKPKSFYENLGYSIMLEMNSLRWTENAPGYVLCMWTLGASGPEENWQWSWGRGRYGTDMQGGGSAQAPAEKQHTSSGEPNIIQWDLSFGRLDMCSREEKGGRVLPVYQTLLLAFTHIILVPSNPHSNIMRHLLWLRPCVTY